MSEYFDMAQSERMIRSLANKVVNRLATIPQKVFSREDIEQELWIAWCKARDKYEPGRGVPWQAFLQRGMKNHINREIEKHVERFEGQTFALSLDMQAGEDNESTLSEVIPSPDPMPHERTERASNYAMAMELLSDRAKVYVSLLHDQPPELLHELSMMHDKAEQAVKVGAPFNVSRHITSRMIFDLMGAERNERSKIKKEVETMGMRMSK
jgi:DNA-directed RNA polymerase specialized sigma24 family protein